MNITPSIALTYGLLALSIIALWFKPWRVADQVNLPPWLAFFMPACICGALSGLVEWTGILALVSFAGVACVARHAKPGPFKVAMVFATGWMTLALSVHKFTGFTNPSVVTNMRISDAAPSFTHNLNFDTTAAGLILFAVFCSSAKSLEQWREIARQYKVIIGAPVLVFAVALAIGYLSFDPKFVAYTPVYLVCNLLFTCVTEEAFFRGFVQHQLSAGLQRWRAGPYVAMVIAALLFGIAHAKGGLPLVGLASLAGLGYGYAYLRSKRIEAAILTHFTLNAIHFLVFTYPRNV